MSYEVRFAGELVFASKGVLEQAIRRYEAAIEDADECDSFVVRDELKVVNKSIRFDVEGSCPASIYEETLWFLDVLAQTATRGRIRCYFEGSLAETLAPPKPTGKKKTTAEKKTAKKKRRIKPSPTKLRWAAQLGDIDKIEALLEAGTDPNVPDPSSDWMKTTPLMMAAYHGRPAAVEQLITAGADVDQQDYAGESALFHAVGNSHKRGRRRCIELLIRAGASTRVRNHEGKTPIVYGRHRAGGEELKEILQTLRAEKKTTNKTTKKTATNKTTKKTATNKKTTNKKTTNKKTTNKTTNKTTKKMATKKSRR